jgi:DNA repair photolyase
MVAPPPSHGDKQRKHPAKLLKPADLPDNFTHSLYKVAPYRGCAHGCRYCDGRAERYFVEGDFERDITLKSTIPDRFASELPSLRERGIISFGSGVTDSYQPLEGIHKITRRCAELLANSSRPFPAMVMTKSNLILDDLPLWKRVNEYTGFLLLVSITSLDENVREVMEPGASSFASRLEMLRAFKAAGCATGVLAMPLLPGISDSVDSMHSLYAACAEAGADFIMPGGLTLRPGRQKDFYLNALYRYRPELLEPTRRIYLEERPSGSPYPAAAKALFERIAPIKLEFAMPYLLPHEITARMLPPYDALRILYRDMLELYSERGIDTSALLKSAKAYDEWLISLRRVFRRKKTLPDTWLEERFADAVDSGELSILLANDRLAHFTNTVINEGARLDYCTLQLKRASPTGIE